MTAKTLKKLITIISFIALIGNCTPIYAQLVELEILGGGYKLRGPAEISFATLSTSTSSSQNTLDFRNIGATTPSQADNNFLLVIDENGGNPFDVTVTSSELKKEEPLITTTTAGSTNNTVKVVSSNGFLVGDTFIFPGYTTPGTYEISSIPDSTTMEINGSFIEGAPPAGLTISRYIDCDISPKKCITLNNFAINHGPDLETVFGNSADFSTNEQTNGFTPFRAAATTIAGSSGTTLKVDNSDQFVSNENISFQADSGVLPLTNVITSIEDSNTITLQNAFTVTPEAGINVRSTDIRTLTLGNGTGAAPGQWKIYPLLRDQIPAGQLPGSYQGALNFTIV